VLTNARRKAEAVWRVVIAEGEAGATAPVLGVDTEVAIDGRTLGKAADAGAALERLEALSGRTHSVLSGAVLLEAADGRSERSGIARSEVTFRELDAATIKRYLDSGEWRDRAGAYAIQGLGSILIERVDGDFSNVVGLPLRLVGELLGEPFAAAGDSARQRGQ
jgi:nucleoside triphosphate pyrophosphatase